jgi:hypothetical protein
MPPYRRVELTKDPAHPPDRRQRNHRRLTRVWLDTSRLGLQISHMVAQLHQRMTPSQLGLGEETSGHVIRSYSNRSLPAMDADRRAAPLPALRFGRQRARVAIGFDAMHLSRRRRGIRPSRIRAASIREEGNSRNCSLSVNRRFAARRWNINIKPRVNYSEPPNGPSSITRPMAFVSARSQPRRADYPQPVARRLPRMTASASSSARRPG